MKRRTRPKPVRISIRVEIEKIVKVKAFYPFPSVFLYSKVQLFQPERRPCYPERFGQKPGARRAFPQSPPQRPVFSRRKSYKKRRCHS